MSSHGLVSHVYRGIEPNNTQIFHLIKNNKIIFSMKKFSSLPQRIYPTSNFNFEDYTNSPPKKKFLINSGRKDLKKSNTVIGDKKILSDSQSFGFSQPRLAICQSDKRKLSIWTLFFVVNFTQILKKRTIKSRLEVLNDYHFELIDDKSYFPKFAFKDLKKKLYLSYTTSKTSFLKKFISSTKSIIMKYIDNFHEYCKSISIFNADSPFIIFSEIIIVLFLFLNIFYAPLVVAFPELEVEQNLRKLFLFEFPSFALIVEVFLNLNTSYYSKGTFIQDRKKIIQKYIQENMFLDFCTIIPYFIYLIYRNPIIILLLLVRYIKLQELVGKFEKQLLLRGKKRGFSRLLNLIINITIIAHIFGCIWILIGTYEKDHNIPNSWMFKIELNFDQKFDIYVNSLYFTIVTMITIGYGDIYPNNTLEKCFGIVFMLLSCGVFAYSLNSVGSIIDEMNKINNNFNSEQNDIDYYMKNEGISKSLQLKIKKFLEYMHDESQRRASSSRDLLLDKISPKLKEEFLIDCNYPLLSKNEFFKNYSSAFLYKLSQKCTEMTFSPGEVILSTDDQENQNFYIVKHGSVELVAIYNDEKNNMVNEYIVSNQCEFQSFGKFPSTQLDVKGLHIVRSVELTTAILISKRDFLKTIMQFPRDFQLYFAIKEEILIYKTKDYVPLDCLFCRSKTHNLPDCEKALIKTDLKKVIKENSFDTVFNYRKFGIRRRIEKFKSLKQNKHIQNELVLATNMIHELINASPKYPEFNNDPKLSISNLEEKLSTRNFQILSTENKVLNKTSIFSINDDKINVSTFSLKDINEIDEEENVENSFNDKKLDDQKSEKNEEISIKLEKSFKYFSKIKATSDDKIPSSSSYIPEESCTSVNSKHQENQSTISSNNYQEKKLNPFDTDNNINKIINAMNTKELIYVYFEKYKNFEHYKIDFNISAISKKLNLKSYQFIKRPKSFSSRKTKGESRFSKSKKKLKFKKFSQNEHPDLKFSLPNQQF